MSEERWWPVLPHALLGLATVAAVLAATTAEAFARTLPEVLGLSAATAVWMLVVPRPGVVHFVGRTVLAVALCLLNPLYAIFGFIGFLDVQDSLPRRWFLPGVLVVAVSQAGAQSGGLPPSYGGQLAVFLVLVVVNTTLPVWLGGLTERIEQRASELEQLNGELEQALAANAALHEQLVAQARDTGVQDERRRLAAEIHDTLAQSLAGIVTQLAASPPDAHRDRALALARSALVEARRSVLDLAPADLEGAALPEALAAVVDRWAEHRAERATTDVVGDVVALHPEVEATVLRVAQEALTNIARHAGAGRVGLTLAYDGDEVVLDVRDDGVGFDATAGAPDSSFGLRGMRQRAARLTGDLVVESRPGAGTAISLRLPALAAEAVG